MFHVGWLITLCEALGTIPYSSHHFCSDPLFKSPLPIPSLQVAERVLSLSQRNGYPHNFFNQQQATATKSNHPHHSRPEPDRTISA
ncbi:hypothetical protein B0T20DRAFT_126382 [Sordaria brevicollis]|uniref:Uncharacterized protein n=1 Tax=Sordaria brevicollis TaxID=83679 RepID=A0AAE0PLE7_SORBR|nr:hypothetical protein B0T20DRAFT_126382 [Sordaria brevicollis]